MSIPPVSLHALRRFLFLLLAVSMLLGGCAKVPYQDGGPEFERNLPVWRDTPQVEVGRPNIVVDVLGNIVALPSKLLLWNWSVGNRNVSDETIASLSTYLQDNDLKNVKVRVNQYAPGAEWRRLFTNKSMNIFWRSTLGLFSTAMYTILPGRVFGGDSYNPYTNTISIYSDHKGIVVHEGGHAKDLYNRRLKGLYSALYIIPLVPLWHEAQATGDAIGYLRDRAQTEEEKDAYKILYPAYGTYIGGSLTQFLPVDLATSYAIQAAVVIPGHIIGRIKAAGVDDRGRAVSRVDCHIARRREVGGYGFCWRPVSRTEKLTAWSETISCQR